MGIANTLTSAVEVASPMLKMDRWQVTFSTVQTPEGNFSAFYQYETDGRKAGGSHVVGHLFSSTLLHLLLEYRETDLQF